MVDYVHGKMLEFKDHNDREVAGVHDEKVIEAFQKFDADGSGNISREELAEAGAAGAKLGLPVTHGHKCHKLMQIPRNSHSR